MVAALGLIGSFVSAQEHAGAEAGAEGVHAAHGAAEAHDTHGEEHPRFPPLRGERCDGESRRSAGNEPIG